MDRLLKSPVVAECTHGAGCPVHRATNGVHNFDPLCGAPLVHAPHLVACVDFDAITHGVDAVDLPVHWTRLCEGGVEPAGGGAW